MKAVIFSLVFALCAKIPTTLAVDGKSYRLPNANIVVNSYTLKIIPELRNEFSFEGTVLIEVKILERTKCITMNSKNLYLKQINVYNGHTSLNGDYKLLEDKEMLEMCFSKEISMYETLTISISFKGEVRDDFKGLYKVQYEENGSKKWLAATLLEPTNARMVFPCFDEPQYKAKFHLSLARYRDQSSLSITPLSETSKEDPGIDNRVWDTFSDSVPCPPYMMSFTIHSFASRTLRSGYLTVYSRKHTDKDVSFIISNYPAWYAAVCDYVNIHNYFDQYIDIIALPDGNEFSQKGTLMIYKEKDVLQIEGVDVEKNKEEITKASIHKVYHLWIGGYARLDWWSDTWLSESFGIYLQYVIANQMNSEWEMENRFITEVLQEALFEEEMHFVSAVSSSTKSPSEIQNQKFNSFINRKGASIINMLQQIVNPYLKLAFQNVIRKAHEDRSEIKSNDLWNEIDRQIKNKNLLPSDMSVTDFMQTWLQNSGYPLITVLTNEHGEVTMKQETYQSSRTTNEILDYTWIIPITCKKKSSTGCCANKKFNKWLRNSELVTTDHRVNKDEWILCNLNQGYYRVTYTKENWLLLTEQLKSQPSKIDRLSRAQLIDDSFHLAINNKLPFSIVYNLGTYLEKESDMLPWFSFVKYVNYFLRYYEETDVFEYLRRYFLNLITPQYKRIGFRAKKEDDYITRIGRPYILAIACRVGLQDCLSESAQMYNTYINDLTKVPAEWKYVVYCRSFETLQYKQAAWNKLWTMHRNSHTMSEKELILSSMACANDDTLFKKYLKMAIDTDASKSTLYYYEKECIVKSIVKFYKGITAVLEIMAELISNLRFQSAQTKQVLILMTKEIQFSINSLEHVEKAKQILKQLESQKDDNSELLEILRQSINLGNRKIDHKIKNSDDIKQALHEITGYTAPNQSTNTTNPSKNTTDSRNMPSSGSRMTTLTAQCLIFFIISILITI
ncbi:glutamyl aminopeptidase-like [Planococcus citri]|uniref:glutamyl aminopeptidase-like n=1 Tax=Planococcus citri TaxID=170843 RepID=UPI0031F9C83A